jgi:hypothetical protein
VASSLGACSLLLSASSALASYGDYFDESVDVDACVYMMLATHMLGTVLPEAGIAIAEEVSGMPCRCCDAPRMHVLMCAA